MIAGAVDERVGASLGMMVGLVFASSGAGRKDTEIDSWGGILTVDFGNDSKNSKWMAAEAAKKRGNKLLGWVTNVY